MRIDLRRVVGRSLSIGLLACAVLAVPFAMRYEDHVAVKKERAEADEQRIVDLVAQTALREIAGVLADVRYLSDHNELRELLVQDSPETRQRLATEYLSFARHKRHYDQIRIIGTDGQEQVRVNARDGAPVIVPAEALQNRRDRYYFAEAIRLEPGAIHVSPLDLNVEHGAIESPRRPTLRVTTPLFGAGGERRGVLVVNYAADHLFARLKALAEATPSDLWLLNSDGYWLIGPAEDEWAFMYPDRRIRTLAARHPDTWRLMEGAREGRLATDDGVVTFRKIYPLVGDSSVSLPALDGAAPADAERYHWIAATFLAQGLLTAQSEAAARDLLLGYGVLALVVLLAAPVWSYYSLQRRELNRIMASILDNVQDLISYVDTGERFRFTNRAQRAALGLGAAAIHGRTLREVLGEAAYGVLGPRVEEVLRGRVASFDARIAYGGDERDLEIAYMPDRDHGGVLHGFVAVESDVTPLRNAERREREQMLELAHAARLASVGEMATQIAHEVNQPLTAIVTYCAAARRALTAQPIDLARINEWLEAIGTQAHRVSDTVRRLREFVRKGAAKFVLLDLDLVVTDAVRIVQPIADRQGVQVARESSPALPQVFADRVLLTQAVLNLVRNAVEAVSASPPEQRLVRIVTAAEGSSVELRVIDSGPGLPADVAGRLFEPFVTTKASGLGLGLPIARSILDALGGEIGYEAMPGGGACFTLNLPIRAS